MPTFFRRASAVHVCPQQESYRKLTRGWRRLKLVYSPNGTLNRCPRVDTLTTFFREHFRPKKNQLHICCIYCAKSLVPQKMHFFLFVSSFRALKLNGGFQAEFISAPKSCWLIDLTRWRLCLQSILFVFVVDLFKVRGHSFAWTKQ